MGPVVAQFTLGPNLIPRTIHRGWVRYHGHGPSVGPLVKSGHIEARAYKQNECFAEAVRFARSEGILPAPEPSHALRAVAEEAAAAREAGDSRVILFNLSGHGHFDLGAYDAYFARTLQDVELPQERLDTA